MSEARFPHSGRALKQARTGKMSQERLAELVGTSRRHIIRLENGENRPTVEMRDRLAVALGVPASTLPAAEDVHPFRTGGR